MVSEMLNISVEQVLTNGAYYSFAPCQYHSKLDICPQEILTVHKTVSHNIFPDAAPKAQATEEILDKLDFIKI